MVGFRLDDLSDLEANIQREWVLTNSIGGYAGGSVTGALNRTHQGYLIASLHPPVERFTALSKTEERIMTGDCVRNLSASIHLKKEHETVADGSRYLTSFISDGAVTFIYELGSIRIRKTLALKYGSNEAAIVYRIENPGEAFRFIVTPLFNWHEHSCPSTGDSIRKVLPESSVRVDQRKEGGRITVKPESGEGAGIFFDFDSGSARERSEKYDDFILLRTERDNEAEGLEHCFTPFDIAVDVKAGGTTVLACVCGIGEGSENGGITAMAEDMIARSRSRAGKLVNLACGRDGDLEAEKHILCTPEDVTDRMLFEALVQAADNFITTRSSTGLSTVLAGLPWFTDWGRDTMIAFTGLTLVTKRFEDAEGILGTFARYEKDGLVPNMFPDDGQDPLYNTADASLWYFYAVHKYLEYSEAAGRGKKAREFVKNDIYPCLKRLIAGYRNGTGFSIGMDSDGLIHAGGGFDQVTWMDVRVGDWVATPRHGKPVEINALWYNALMIMAGLALEFDDCDAEDYAVLAGRVKVSFRDRFWNEEGGYLYDVVDCDEDSRISESPDDARFRPNQIYAVSLPYQILEPEKERMITDRVFERLYVGCGLRSLDPDDPDYHPIYQGSLDKRDHAYHQGTAWGFLLGGFITAYVKTHGPEEGSGCGASGLLDPVRDHLFRNCIGSICEIFDGDAPHNGRGCYAQAWSVGEVLRCLSEDILQNNPSDVRMKK